MMEPNKFRSLNETARRILSGEKQINEQVGDIVHGASDSNPFYDWQYPDGRPTPPGWWYNPSKDQSEPSDLDLDQEWVERMKDEIAKLRQMLEDCLKSPGSDKATCAKIADMLEEALDRLEKFLRDRGWDPAWPGNN